MSMEGGSVTTQFSWKTIYRPKVLKVVVSYIKFEISFVQEYIRSIRNFSRVIFEL